MRASWVGGLLAVRGSHSAEGKGPFPQDGLIPFLKPLADYGWAVGPAAALVLYVALMLPTCTRAHVHQDGLT